MDHEAICDCAFKGRCATFNDPLIDAPRKGPSGLGCRGQTDHHRARHCRTFACSYLSLVFSDAMRRLASESTRQ